MLVVILQNILEGSLLAGGTSDILQRGQADLTRFINFLVLRFKLDGFPLLVLDDKQVRIRILCEKDLPLVFFERPVEVAWLQLVLFFELGRGVVLKRGLVQVLALVKNLGMLVGHRKFSGLEVGLLLHLKAGRFYCRSRDPIREAGRNGVLGRILQVVDLFVNFLERILVKFDGVELLKWRRRRPCVVG